MVKFVSFYHGKEHLLDNGQARRTYRNVSRLMAEHMDDQKMDIKQVRKNIKDAFDEHARIRKPVVYPKVEA